jgi:hypothetical protein
MAKGTFLRICLLIILFIFCLNFKVIALAKDCQEGTSGAGTPTSAGSAGYTEEWRQTCDCDGGSPVIHLSSDTVLRNNFIEAWVDSGNQACPTYTWTINGNGFYFYDTSGPTTASTGADSERIEIWADSAACGSAIITVTDKCGEKVTSSARQPNNGKWVLIEEITCGTVDSQPGSGNCNSDYYCTEGAYRYLDSWVAGTNMGTRWHPIGNCTKYPCTPYDRNYCYDPGYEPKFYHVGIQYKKKWIWDCP